MEVEIREIEKELKSLLDEYTKNTKELFEMEARINLLKANLTSQEGIVALPNQTMREARMEEIMQTDPEYSSTFRRYLELKTENKVLYLKWTLALELNKNARVFIMKGDSND